MSVKLIVAVSLNNVMGNSITNKLPWEGMYGQDMKFFRQSTSGHTIIMGRHTYESIGRPLPKRKNIVITRTKLDIPGVECFDSLKEATMYSESFSANDTWLIGGAGIYKEGIESGLVDELFISQIPEIFEGEGLVYFPTITEKYKLDETIVLDEEVSVLKYKRN